MKSHLLKTIAFIGCIICTIKAHTQTNIIDSLQKVLEMQKEDTSRINVLDKIATHLWHSGDLNNSKQYAQQELALASKTGNEKGKADAILTLGTLFEFDGKYDQARKYYTTALDYYKKVENKDAMANVYDRFASSYNEEGNAPEALAYTYSALQLYEEIDDKLDMASTYVELGFFSISENDYKKAMELLNKALGNKVEIALVETAIAEIDNKQGDYSEALRHDSLAIA